MQRLPDSEKRSPPIVNCTSVRRSCVSHDIALGKAKRRAGSAAGGEMGWAEVEVGNSTLQLASTSQDVGLYSDLRIGGERCEEVPRHEVVDTPRYTTANLALGRGSCWRDGRVVTRVCALLGAHRACQHGRRVRRP